MKTRDFFRRLRPDARLLLIRLRSMGDCLLLTGPVRALKEEFPKFRISVLVDSRFAPCFEGNPDFSQIIPVERKSQAVRLLGRRFHAVINLHGGPTSFAYSCLSWGPRIGLEQYRFGWAYNGLAPKPDSAFHTTTATMSIFQWLGMKRNDSPALRYEAHAAEAAKMREATGSGAYAVIHPGALLATKRWRSERYAVVAEALQRRGLTPVLTCGAGEESAVSEVAKGAPGSKIMFGLSIPELAELIRGARIYVGNDSGPMHLAAAVGTPTLAVWGSSDSRRWRPWQVEHRVVQNLLECNPCPGYRCHVADTPTCIESVTIEQVIAAMEELLAQPRSR